MVNHHDIRQTAVDAERHWWHRKIAEHIATLRPMAGTSTNIGHWSQIEIERLEAIIAARVK